MKKLKRLLTTFTMILFLVAVVPVKPIYAHTLTVAPAGIKWLSTQTNVDPMKTWTIKFSKELFGNSVGRDSIKIYPVYENPEGLPGYTPVNCKIELNGDGVKIYAPIEDMGTYIQKGYRYNETYIMVIKPWIKDKEYHTMQNEYRMKFRIKPASGEVLTTKNVIDAAATNLYNSKYTKNTNAAFNTHFDSIINDVATGKRTVLEAQNVLSKGYNIDANNAYGTRGVRIYVDSVATKDHTSIYKALNGKYKFDHFTDAMYKGIYNKTVIAYNPTVKKYVVVTAIGDVAIHPREDKMDTSHITRELNIDKQKMDPYYVDSPIWSYRGYNEAFSEKYNELYGVDNIPEVIRSVPAIANAIEIMNENIIKYSNNEISHISEVFADKRIERYFNIDGQDYRVNVTANTRQISLDKLSNEQTANVKKVHDLVNAELQKALEYIPWDKQYIHYAVRYNDERNMFISYIVVNYTKTKLYRP